MKKKIKKYIVFSKSRLTGYFRYKNEFQIFPATFEDLPSNRHAKHFPIVIEFWIYENENVDIPEEYKEFDDLLELSEGTNGLNKLNQICHLLSAISNYRFFLYDYSGGRWFLELPDDDIKKDNVKNVVWGLSLFTYSNLKRDLTGNNFTKLNNIETVKPKEHFDYYLNDPQDNSDQEIQFSENMYIILTGFFGLNKKMKKAAISSSYLICNGMDLRTKMKSLSFLALISSIETLVNVEYSTKLKKIEFECGDCKTIKESPYNCHKCGRPIWGIAAKFREFLAEFLHNSDESIKKYKKIYGLRSKLVHSGSLLLGDNYIDWSDHNSPNSNWLLHLEAMQFSKLALVNWLIENRNRRIEAENKDNKPNL